MCLELSVTRNQTLQETHAFNLPSLSAHFMAVTGAGAGDTVVGGVDKVPNYEVSSLEITVS